MIFPTYLPQYELTPAQVIAFRKEIEAFIIVISLLYANKGPSTTACHSFGIDLNLVQGPKGLYPSLFISLGLII